MGEDSDPTDQDAIENTETESDESFIWESDAGDSDSNERGDLETFESESQDVTSGSLGLEDGSVSESGEKRSPSKGERDSLEGTSERIWGSFGTGSPETGAAPDEPETDHSEGSETDERLWDRSEPDTGDGTSETSDQSPTGEADNRNNVGTEDPVEPSSFDRLLEDRSTSNPRETDAERTASTASGTSGLFDELGEFDRTSSGSQVLVLSPLSHSVTQEVFEDFLTAGTAAGRNVMLVSTRDRNESVLSPVFREVSTNGDANLTVIELGDVSMGGGEMESDSVTISAVSNPKNLSKCGLVVMQTLRTWEGNDFPTAFCFHSLSDLRGFVDDEVLFQFLFTLKQKLKSSGASGLFHMDPGKHDTHQVNTLKELFDIVVSISRDKDVEIL